MTQEKSSKKEEMKKVEAMFTENPDYVRQLLQGVCQNIIEAERTEDLGAESYERTPGRKGYRSGYKSRQLKTRVGKLELRVPQTKGTSFYPTVFERYQRSEKALNLTLMEAYVQGVSTRRMKKITEQLCGTEFSATTISNLTKDLDEELDKFRNRKLTGEYQYLIVDARYENVRQNAAVVKQAVLSIAGISKAGYREILSVEIADLESEATWGETFRKLKQRGLKGVKFIVSDNHKGIKAAVTKHFTGCMWQRCKVHYLRNLMGMVKWKDKKTIVKMLQYIWDSEKIEEAREKAKQVIKFYEDKNPKIADHIEDSIEDTLNVMILPLSHRRRMSSTNMLERLNESIRQRTRVARIFPNEKSCLRLITAVLLEIHEDWISGRHYLNMSADDSQSVFDGKEKKESVMECNDVQGDIILGLSSLAVNA